MKENELTNATTKFRIKRRTQRRVCNCVSVKSSILKICLLTDYASLTLSKIKCVYFILNLCFFNLKLSLRSISESENVQQLQKFAFFKY